MKTLYEIVKVFDLESIEVNDDEEFRFRLEVMCDMSSKLYSGRVYRLETYRLRPTFPQLNGKLPDYTNDASIYVVDDSFNLESMREKSMDEVVAVFQKKLIDRFGDLVLGK